LFLKKVDYCGRVKRSEETFFFPDPDTTTNPRGKERRKEDVWNMWPLPREVMPQPPASIAAIARGPKSLF
jgi:hypothetical protein